MKAIHYLLLVLSLTSLSGCQSEEDTNKFLLMCKYGQPQTIELMLKNGIDVDSANASGINGLMVAAAENRRDIVDVLLKHQASTESKTQNGITALMFAAARGSEVSLVNDLISAKSDINTMSKANNTALMLAISDGRQVSDDYKEIMDMKIDQYVARKNPAGDALDKIFLAAAQQSLERGAGTLFLTQDMALEISPGIFKKNSLELAKTLLSHGARVNVNNSEGQTPLYIAVEEHRSSELIDLLVNAGADTTVTDNDGTTLLMLASANDDLNIVNALAKKPEDVNRVNKAGQTPLQFASQYSKPDVVSTLIKAGADVNFMPKNGLSALMQAVLADKKDNVSVLIAADVDINKKNKDEISALGFSRKGPTRELLLNSSAALTGQERYMAQNDLNYCINELLDGFMAAKMGSGHSPAIWADNCEGFGRVSVISISDSYYSVNLDKVSINYYGKSLDCEIADKKAKCQ